MPICTLYEICLSYLLENSFVNINSFKELPLSCLHDILPYLSPYELERLDFIYNKGDISINDLWRRHFELIWSLSYDDKNSYQSIINIPYKRLYFEYLFHDTQILQLGIYTYISEINKSKSIIHLSFIEHIKYNLTRDSIIYCSKRRLSDENQNLIIIWNHQWNKYIHRFIFVPHIWNLAKMNPLLIECLTENLRDIVLSGYPTENDYYGMKYLLDILRRGYIKNLVIKFPSYCLMNILLPLLIFPRLYSLSYFSTINENDFKQTNLFLENFFLPFRKRKLCLQVEIEKNQENYFPINRVLSINDHLNNSTHTIRSNSSTFDMKNESFFQTNDLISLTDNNKSTIQPYERLRPYLNRSRTHQQYSTSTSIRHLSTSEQSVPLISPPTNLLSESFSSSDSNLFRRHTNPLTTISSLPINNYSSKKIDDEEKFLIFHLTPENQINSLTNLSIYYVSSFETIQMIAIALLGMNQIHHLTLVNFAIYSSELETSLITLCTRSQLQSLHLTSISLKHGAIGFILQLFGNKTNEKSFNINLKHLRLDAIKIFSLLNDNIHLSDIEQTEFISNSSLEQFIWRERHMQYIHIRLLYKFLPNILSKLHRLELSSILECVVFDQYAWCQTFLHNISDVRLRNFRIHSNNLTRFFFALNTQCILTVFHFERIGLTWNNDQQSTFIYDAFTSLILNAKHLIELSLAYNNLNNNFIQWLCQLLLRNDTEITTSWWSIRILNLTFNLISSESIRILIQTLKEYKNRWGIRYSPIRRIDILGNALEMREIANLKKQFNAIGCDLISYIFN